MKYLLFVLLLIAVLITAGCVGGDQISNKTPTAQPTPTYDAAEVERVVAAERVNQALAAAPAATPAQSIVKSCTHLSDMKENEIATNVCAIGSDYPAISTRDLAHPVVGNWSDGGRAIMIYSDGTADIYGFYMNKKNMGTQHTTWDVDQYPGNSAKNLYHIYTKNGGIFNFMYYQETDTIDGLHTDERALLIRDELPLKRVNWK